VHHTASALWGALLGKLSKGIAVVRSEHNNHQFHSVGQNVANWISELLADRILCNSQDTYRNLHSWEKWAVKGRWEKVYNGVDVGRIDRAKQRGDYLGLDESEDKIVVGSVGRFVRQKNYERLIHALPMVVREKPSVHLVLVGDGEKRRALEDLARELGLSDRVTFLGEVPRDRVYTFLHEFDLFVVPSLWEGFCNAAVEAMAAGLPIACSEIRTLQEVVGDVATYFNPESADSIARGLISLLQEGPVKWRECGQACRKRAIDNYSIERTANAYVRNYFAAVGWSMPESDLKPA
jgi:glycosyltransferase involved in cell wall biosynthesis